MAVPVMIPRGTTALDVGAAVPLFEPRVLNGPGPALGFRQQYDLARDGRLLLNVPVDDATPASITVVVNWTEGIKK